MCGIVGVINGENFAGHNVRNFLEQGSLFGLVRGDDSTGMFQIGKGWKSRVHKLPVDGYYFRNNKLTQDYFRKADECLATIMHHRAATAGSVSQENAHPFTHKVDKRTVIGVHNGTLQTSYGKEDGIHFDVDSDWLYYMIAKHGAKEALGKHVKGSYALVWAEMPNNVIRIAGNRERPIHWGYVRDKNIMLVASEAGMLYSLASRNGLVLEKCLYPDEETIYTFDLTKDLRAFTEEKIEKKSPPVAHSGTTGTTSATSNVTELRPTGAVTAFENDRVAVHDLFGGEVLSKADFCYLEQAEFFFDKAVRLKGKSTYDILGTIMKEKEKADVVVCNAIICGVKQEVVDNLRDCRENKCSVIGLRRTIDKRTGLAKEEFIMTAPTSLTVYDDSLASMDDLDDPWESAGTVEGPGRKPIPTKEFLRLIQSGCQGCGKNLSIHDASELGWINNDPVCDDCCIKLAGS